MRFTSGRSYLRAQAATSDRGSGKCPRPAASTRHGDRMAKSCTTSPQMRRSPPQRSTQRKWPVPLFHVQIYGGGTEGQQGRQYDVARDGRFLIDTVLADTTPITLLQNWKPPLAK